MGNKTTLRRQDRAVSAEETKILLQKGEYGVLAMVDDEGFPYCVAVNYVYCPISNTIIFHGAVSGRKWDILRKNPQVSFCVVSNCKVLPEKFSNQFESVIVFGKIRLLDAPEEKREKLRLLCEKYSPDHLPEGDVMIEKHLEQTGVFEIIIEAAGGKQNKE